GEPVSSPANSAAIVSGIACLRDRQAPGRLAMAVSAHSLAKAPASLAPQPAYTPLRTSRTWRSALPVIVGPVHEVAPCGTVRSAKPSTNADPRCPGKESAGSVAAA